MPAQKHDLAVRRLVPEILDGLAADHPAAIASRRDLVRVNALMFQDRIMIGLMRKHVRAGPLRILEIGAGDGRFMLAVARRVARHWPAVELVLLDRLALVSDRLRDDFSQLGWHVQTIKADIFEWIATAGAERFDVVTANLFLHHFADAGLARLFASLKPLAPLLLATEPRRAGFPHAATRLLWAIGANYVTKHDAAASVRAGFAGCELSDIWLAGEGTVIEERHGGLFTHVFAGLSPPR
jgi:Methyltransferase domain